MLVRDACPKCRSTWYKKNGHTHQGRQNHQCQACERQFVATAEDRSIADEQRTLIEYLLRERSSRCAVSRDYLASGQKTTLTPQSLKA